MKSIEEHNASTYTKINEPIFTNIKCPDCDKAGKESELLYPNPMVVLASWPAKKEVVCSVCKYRGYVLA